MIDVVIKIQMLSQWRKLNQFWRQRKEHEQNRRQLATRTLAYHLWEADGRPDGESEYYYLEAEKKLRGYRWLLYLLHQPWIWLEKKRIEPLHRWISNLEIIEIYTKIFPFVETLGLLIIPVMILFFESRREERQAEFEQRIIAGQITIRQHQAVKEYFSEVTTLYLETEQGTHLKGDLLKLLQAKTFILLNELSIDESKDDDETIRRGVSLRIAKDGKYLDKNDQPLRAGIDGTARDRKGQIVKLLADLGLVISQEEQEPLMSLEGSNLVYANLDDALLDGALLDGAYLIDTSLREASLKNINLNNAALNGADLYAADLSGASLINADLNGADFIATQINDVEFNGFNISSANLSNANLEGANFRADL